MAKKTTPTGWVGWIYFAGAMLLAVGGMQIIAGLAALFKDDFYVVNSSGLIAFNYTTWGWINLILGTVVMLAGVGVWTGRTWARIVAVFLSVLALLSHVSFISAYPLWSIIGITINVFVIFALTAHGDETRID